MIFDRSYPLLHIRSHVPTGRDNKELLVAPVAIHKALE